MFVEAQSEFIVLPSKPESISELAEDRPPTFPMSFVIQAHPANDIGSERFSW
jgi:hypothetical protein